MLITYIFRDLRDKITRNTDDFRMITITDDFVAGLQVRHTGSYLQHDTRIAVSQRQRLIELTEHGLQRWHEAVGLDLIEDLFDLVRLLPGLLDQVRLAELDQHLLRTRGDQRSLRPDQYLTPSYLRAGYFRKFHLAGLQVLEDLFQLL